jgi:hypothetical protein
MGCTVWGSNLCRGQKFFSSVKCADRLWGHPASYLMCIGIPSWGMKHSGHTVSTYHYIVPRARISRAIPVLLHGVERELLTIAVTFRLIV